MVVLKCANQITDLQHFIFKMCFYKRKKENKIKKCVFAFCLFKENKVLKSSSILPNMGYNILRTTFPGNSGTLTTDVPTPYSEVSELFASGKSTHPPVTLKMNEKNLASVYDWVCAHL